MPPVNANAVKLIRSLTGTPAIQSILDESGRMLDKGLHPTHGAYMRAQCCMGILSEELLEYSGLAKLRGKLADAEAEYMPSGPPMSPLTISYFTMWTLCDVTAGPRRETLGQMAGQVCEGLGLDADLRRLIRAIGDSRMGIYRVETAERDLTVLRELVTGYRCEVLVPAGYPGEEGELWYARVLPPPFAGTEEHLVVTTPYVLSRPGEAEWLAYFQRAAGGDAEGYARHMKCGPEPNYWNEFVLEAYANHRPDAIFLAGLPDVEASRPNSRMNSGL